MITAAAIASQPELSSVLIRMMISVNDIALAADAIDLWAAETRHKRKARLIPAQQYFVRILLSHVYEALTIIKEIDSNPKLRSAVDKCDRRTVSDFNALVAISKAEKEHLRLFRNRATFHYDKHLSGKFLSVRPGTS
jgi:hypothetical protein